MPRYRRLVQFHSSTCDYENHASAAPAAHRSFWGTTKSIDLENQLVMSASGKKKLVGICRRMDAIRDGYTTRAELADLLGDAKLHSLQRWRTGPNSTETLIFALGAKQLANVRDTHVAQIKKVEQQAAKLTRQLAKHKHELKNCDDRLSAQEQELHELRAELLAAKIAADAADARAEEAQRAATLAQRNMDQMSINAQEIPMIKEFASLTGKSSAHLVLDASPMATGVPFAVQPTNGLPRSRGRTRRNDRR
ncbi:hypothetical protein ACSFA7_00005 [Variovorax sp. LT1R20]|uniref:hypothetical protein n=1 Tax=Variovorax sp. LT1R20 TaxID=3443729 RepID=UPI003F46467A